MKKNYLLIFTAIFLFGMQSCQTDIEITLQADSEISPMVADPWFTINLGAFVSQYEQKAVPATVAEENLHRTIFAAMMPRWIHDQYWARVNAASGAYSAWNEGRRIYAGQNPSRMAEIEQILALKMSEVSAKSEISLMSGLYPPSRADDILFDAESFKKINDQLFALTQSEEGYLNPLPGTESLYFQLAAINAGITVGFDLDEMENTWQRVIPALDYRKTSNNSKRPYENCFMIDDGLDYMRTQGNYRITQSMYNVLTLVMPVLLAMENSEDRFQFFYDFVAFCDENEITDIDSEVNVSRMFIAVATAVYALDYGLNSI